MGNICPSWAHHALNVVLIWSPLHSLIFIIRQIHLKAMEFQNLVSCILSSACLSLRELSQLSLFRYMDCVCFQLQLTCLLMIVEILVIHSIITIKLEIWIISKCLGIGHETMVCAVCLAIFIRICDMDWLLRCISFTLPTNNTNIFNRYTSVVVCLRWGASSYPVF